MYIGSAPPPWFPPPASRLSSNHGPRWQMAEARLSPEKQRLRAIHSLGAREPSFGHSPLSIAAHVPFFPVQPVARPVCTSPQLEPHNFWNEEAGTKCARTHWTCRPVSSGCGLVAHPTWPRVPFLEAEKEPAYPLSKLANTRPLCRPTASQPATSPRAIEMHCKNLRQASIEKRRLDQACEGVCVTISRPPRINKSTRLLYASLHAHYSPTAIHQNPSSLACPGF
ncbi:hypothetical protein BS50DRAFT_391978 [Corynespora cassiicola Philippines]|uniref:Uncharacterized protein n=1 Tax=Corynespora cassiicola Philippines TaxID=1448308 RepID=A0A2T2NPV3_CORCC|nr:hypothetical protein BS50DRAFT_391978 [Corynespora cassiicola Philippines]